MMRSRLGVVVLVTAIALLASTGSASACLTTSGTASPDRAGPGDPIHFSIAGIEPGANYSVSVGGQTVETGVNSSTYNGVSGSFPMPDFGDQPKTVWVEMYVDHDEVDGYKNRHTDSVEYLPPVTAAPPTPSKSPVASSPSPKSHKAKQRVSVVQPAAEQGRQHSGGSGAAIGAAPADAVGSEPESGKPDSGSGSSEQAAEESSSVPDQVLDALGSTSEVGPAKVPTLGLLLMALIFVAGTALAAFAIYLLQTGPDSKAATKAPAPLGPDPIEVELQEVIADEMSRKLLSDLELSDAPDPVGLRD